MKFIAQMLRQLYRRVFHANKPGPKVSPQDIKGRRLQKANESPEPTAKPKEDQRPFWQDKLEADATDKKEAFYVKYRDRLQNQDHDISPKH